MESQTERAERKNSNKAAASIIAILIIVGIGFAVFKAGVIPGLGGGNKVAEELKVNVEAFKGDLGAKVQAFLKSDKFTKNVSPERKQKLQAEVDEAFKDLSATFDYSEIKTSTGNGLGTVTLANPKLVVITKKDNSQVEIAAPQLVFSRSVSDAHHYFFHTIGDLDLFTNAASGKEKLVSLSADASENEMKTNDIGEVVYTKSTAKNLKFIEGRGNSVIFTIGDASSEIGQTRGADNVDAYAKLNYKNIMPGDMVKTMLGLTEPLALTMDYAYKGDNLGDYFNKLADEGKAGLQNGAMKSFNGNLTVNNFSLMMGTTGFVMDAKLVFIKENTKSIPTGTINLKIAQYQKLIDFLGKSAPLPPEQVKKSVEFLSEIGHNANGDITIDVKLDGTENATIGGKTLDQIKAIGEKYYPRQPSPYAPPMGSSKGAVKGVPMEDLEGSKI